MRNPSCSLCLKKCSRGGMCSSCSITFSWSEEYQGWYSRDKRKSHWKGENELYSILGIIFPGKKILTSFRPIWCKSPKGAPLEFDFFIPEERLLVELNGEQHYKFTPWFDGVRGQKKFAARRKNDITKVRAAQEMGYRMCALRYRSPIRIDYVRMSLEGEGREG